MTGDGLERDGVMDVDSNATAVPVSVPANQGEVWDKEFSVQNGIIEPGFTEIDGVGGVHGDQ